MKVHHRPMPILRLAYATQFLIALIAVFTLWSQVGGQSHLDLMPWYLKLGLGVGAAFAVVKATAAAVAGSHSWNAGTLKWFGILLLLLTGCGLASYYCHMYIEPNARQQHGERGPSAQDTGGKDRRRYQDHSGQIREQEPGGFAGGLGHPLGSHVAGTHGAFHGGGPTGPRPIAGQVEVGDSGIGGGPQALGIGRGRKGGALLLDDVGLDELGVAHAREIEAQIADGDKIGRASC